MLVVGGGVQRWRRWCIALLPAAGCLVSNPAWLGDDGADATGSVGVDGTDNPGGDGGDDDDDDAMGTAGPPATGGVTGTGNPGEGEGPTPESTAAPPPSDWWDTAWQYRRQVAVTLDTAVQRPTAVPIVIEDSTDPLRFAELGRDVRFVTSSGQHVPHEIDTWQPLEGPAIVWLRLDPGHEAEPLYMYYGNPMATAGDGSAPVWSPEFYAVWHLGSEDDSTQQTGELVPVVEVEGGMFGDAAAFSPGSEVLYATFGDIVPGSTTITAWIFPMSAGEQDEGRIVDVVIPQTELTVALHLTSFAGEPNLAVTLINGGTRTLSALTGTTLGLAQWHFVALTVNDALEVQLFLDGDGGPPEPLVVDATVPTVVGEPTVAIGGSVDGQPLLFDGTIDEVRVRVENLVAEEMLAEYMSQQTSAALLGAEESYP